MTCRARSRASKTSSPPQKKGEPTTIPIIYPSITQLVRGCSMKPSLNHQYRVSDLCLDNVIVKFVKSPESFLTNEDVMNLSKVNLLYREMIHDVIDLRLMDFTKMKELRIGYAEQTAIDPTRVDMATACAIHYSSHPRMVIIFLKGKYVGENRKLNQILSDISPFIDETDAAHIKRILTQGCPSKLSFKETMTMKASKFKKETKQLSKCTLKLSPKQ